MITGLRPGRAVPGTTTARAEPGRGAGPPGGVRQRGRRGGPVPGPGRRRAGGDLRRGEGADRAQGHGRRRGGATHPRGPAPAPAARPPLPWLIRGPGRASSASPPTSSSAPPPRAPWTSGDWAGWPPPACRSWPAGANQPFREIDLAPPGPPGGRWPVRRPHGLPGQPGRGPHLQLPHGGRRRSRAEGVFQAVERTITTGVDETLSRAERPDRGLMAATLGLALDRIGAP
jgi:hypothetical protein